MLFWLGTHEPQWTRQTAVPLFLSRRRIALRCKTPQQASGPVAIDSGGFTELSAYGHWTVSPQQYADEVRRWRDAFGTLRWAAIQDWMCEPFILEKTGQTVKAHQQRTLESWAELNRIAPDLPWVPVLQGWEYDDYFAHVEQYAAAGVDLAALPLVGIGTVCRRQDTGVAEAMIRDLAARGLRLHGFGFKFGGVVRCARYLESADSLAWSYNARRNLPLPGCTHKNCNSCLKWALLWRQRLLFAIERGKRARVEPDLFVAARNEST